MDSKWICLGIEKSWSLLATRNHILQTQQFTRSYLLRKQSTNSAIRKGLSKNQKGTTGRKQRDRETASASALQRIEAKKERDSRRNEKAKSPGFSALRQESERQERTGKSKKDARAAGFSKLKIGLQNQEDGARHIDREKGNTSVASRNRSSHYNEIASDRRRRERNKAQYDGAQNTRRGDRDIQHKKDGPQTTASVLRRSLKDLEQDLEGLERSEEETPKYSESATKNRWPTTQSKESTEPLRSFFPRSIPYTTAASQFLYGTSSVKAALRANRRKFYKLYVLTNVEKHRAERIKIENIAQSKGAVVKRVDETWIPLLDKISNSRPHNGLVLEASNLPVVPVKSLSAASMEKETFHAILEPQREEDEAINGTNPETPFKSNNWRFPFVLLLDQILDPGNLGAILRSAYYFGVDAIAVTAHGSSPITSVVLKAAAGAAEDIKLFKVNNAVDFLTESKKAGWDVHCADKPGPLTSSLSHYSPVPLYRMRRQNILQRPKPRAKMTGLLKDRPCILIMGGEGWGVSEAVKKKAECLVTIPGERDIGRVDVESLNVSVASALLIADYLRPTHEFAKVIKDKEAPHRDLGFSISPMTVY